MAKKPEGYRGQWTDPDGQQWDVWDTGTGERRPIDDTGPARLHIPTVTVTIEKRPGGRPAKYDYEGMLTHALLHFRHRERDERGRVIANIENDYAAVYDLLGDLLPEASEGSVPKTVRETVKAVATATEDFPPDDGATTKTIAKLLGLDTSAASRRLITASAKGPVQNLQTNKYRPAQWRCTAEKASADPVAVLPHPRALRG